MAIFNPRDRGRYRDLLWHTPGALTMFAPLRQIEMVLESKVSPSPKSTVLDTELSGLLAVIGRPYIDIRQRLRERK
jgi:hypothetical protein